jgi:hypothetical protein
VAAADERVVYFRGVTGGRVDALSEERGKHAHPLEDIEDRFE